MTEFKTKGYVCHSVNHTPRNGHLMHWWSQNMNNPMPFNPKMTACFRQKTTQPVKLKQQTYTSLQLHLPRTVVFAFSPVPQFAMLGLHALLHFPQHLLHLPKHLGEIGLWLHLWVSLLMHPATLVVALSRLCKLGHSQPAPSPALIGSLPEDMFSHGKWEPLASSKTERMWAPQNRWKVAAAPCDWRPRFVEGV